MGKILKLYRDLDLDQCRISNLSKIVSYTSALKFHFPASIIFELPCKHTHTHTHRDIQGLRGGALGGCVFSSEETLTTIISTQVAADIMNWAFQT